MLRLLSGILYILHEHECVPNITATTAIAYALSPLLLICHHHQHMCHHHHCSCVTVTGESPDYHLRI
jgi:hypothetical protein